jgi:hypothetical protein
MDLSSLADDNDSHKFVLTCIDVFSRYARAQPIKNKSGVVVTAAAKKMFEEAVPKRVQVDEGKEWYNTHFKKLMKDLNITMFSSHNEPKASLVERMNKTLKNRLYRYMLASRTARYVDVLQDVVVGYNNTVHRTIGMKPADVNVKNSNLIWHRLYDKQTTIKKPRLSVGDNVRIVKEKKVFTRGYWPRWTAEYFTVHKVLKTTPPTYRLKDLHNDILTGSFYEPELQKIPIPTQPFRIEKVIKRRGKRLLVKWWGWDSSYNSWIHERDIEK